MADWMHAVKAALEWLFFGKSREKRQQATKEAQHLQNALAFADRRLNEIKAGHAARQAAQQHVGAVALGRLDVMDGQAFERFVGDLFVALGHSVEYTPTSGDYGVDLIAKTGTTRIAIQVKRWQGSVGLSAVQEALAGMSFYRCTQAMVVTNSHFTKQAKQLAESAKVTLVDKKQLALLIGKAKEKGSL